MGQAKTQKVVGIGKDASPELVPSQTILQARGIVTLKEPEQASAASKGCAVVVPGLIWSCWRGRHWVASVSGNLTNLLQAELCRIFKRKT